jgi:hypothetical protein
VKKISCIILLLFYLIYVTGVTVHQHYCMGEWVSFSLYHKADKECGKCGMKKHTEESKDCCKDISIVAKSDKPHPYSQVSYDLNLPVPILPPLTGQESLTHPTCGIAQILYRDHSPPLHPTPLFIQFQNFRI